MYVCVCLFVAMCLTLLCFLMGGRNFVISSPSRAFLHLYVRRTTTSLHFPISHVSLRQSFICGGSILFTTQASLKH